MPRKEQGWITFQSSEEEKEILDQVCQQSQRTKTEVLRELVRGLKQRSLLNSNASQLPQPLSIVLTDESEDEGQHMQPITVSARNVLQGTIRKLITSPVNTEVTLEIVPGVELVSVITTASAKRLGLHEGKEMYAVIKSSNIMLAEGK